MPSLKEVASSVWRLLCTLLAIPSNQFPFYYFWDRVSLCNSHWSRTLCVDLDGHRLIETYLPLLVA